MPCKAATAGSLEAAVTRTGTQTVEEALRRIALCYQESVL